MIGRGNATKAVRKLGWTPRYKMGDVARMLVDSCRVEFGLTSDESPISNCAPAFAWLFSHIRLLSASYPDRVTAPVVDVLQALLIPRPIILDSRISRYLIVRRFVRDF